MIHKRHTDVQSNSSQFTTKSGKTERHMTSQL